MKKQKEKSRQRRRKLNATQLKEQRNRVLNLTAGGKNRAVVAATLGIGVNKLREDFALELEEGRRLATETADQQSDDAALTPAEYHALDAITTSFAGVYYDEKIGNLIWAGTDGIGARTIEDAFAAWKQRGGKFNTSGLSSRFNRDKAAEFSKIIANYNRTNTGK